VLRSYIQNALHMPITTLMLQMGVERGSGRGVVISVEILG